MNYDTKTINAFCSNDDNFEAIEFNDPRAVAIRARSAANQRRRHAAFQRSEAAAAVKAATFTIGQAVRGARGIAGTVLAIEGKVVTVDVAGVVRKFVASALVAA